MQSFKPSLTVANCGIWATMLSAFAGAEAASFMGSEIKRPRRDIPRALLIAGFLVVAGYVLGTLAILVVVPREQLNSLEGLMQAISSSARARGMARPGACGRAAHLLSQAWAQLGLIWRQWRAYRLWWASTAIFRRYLRGYIRAGERRTSR